MSASKSFVNEIFMPNYSPLLWQRADSFKIIFQELEKMNKAKYLLVETGTSRARDSWTGDGQSTRLYDHFVNFYDGKVFSVDISEDACSVAREMVSNKSSVVCSDSVNFLNNFPNPEDIDLLYLDSFDLDWNNVHPSAFHHIKELCAIYARLPKGCIIVVDDNNQDKGKGIYVKQFLTHLGAECLFNLYQIGFKKP